MIAQFAVYGAGKQGLGKITVQSKLGEGSAFIISLPLMNEDARKEDMGEEGKK